ISGSIRLRDAHFGQRATFLRSCSRFGSWHIPEAPPTASDVGLPATTGQPRGTGINPTLVESRCDAGALGRTNLFPPLLSGGASIVQPWLARRSLALRPAHARCHPFVTRRSKASAISLPP